MQSPTILILDQEKAIRDSLQLVLSDEGYQCFTARDMNDAIRKLTNQYISVIILDSELAVKTNFLKRINNQYPAVKFIVISSYAVLEADQRALGQITDEFILKPLNFDELIDRIKKLLAPSSI